MKEYISKSQELNEIIEKLYSTSDENFCEDICGLLDSVYLDDDGTINEDFRHEYSSISGKIKELNSIEVEGSKVFSIDYLLENINNVYEYAVKHKKKYVKNLFKLKDHISLEAGRINSVEQLRWEINNGQQSVKTQLEYMNSFATSIAEQIHDTTGILTDLQGKESVINDNIEKAKETLNELDKLSEEVEKKMESVHRDSITILGIFASIVLSFTAGLVFTSSVLQNIDKASPFRLFGITLVIGFVLVNILTILLAYIQKIKSVKYSKVVYPNCVKYINAIIGICLVIDICLWIVIVNPYNLNIFQLWRN